MWWFLRPVPAITSMTTGLLTMADGIHGKTKDILIISWTAQINKSLTSSLIMNIRQDLPFKNYKIIFKLLQIIVIQTITYCCSVAKIVPKLKLVM